MKHDVAKEPLKALVMKANKKKLKESAYGSNLMKREIAT
jgi:hypothetical protein